MGTTFARFQKYLKEQLDNGSIYLWGGQGETLGELTDAYIKKRETSAANAKRVIKLRDARKKKNPGLRAYDCSGLGMYFLLNIAKTAKKDMTADMMMKACRTISKAGLKKGDWVFRTYRSGKNKGKAYHIGYVYDDGLYVVEAYGRDKGVIRRTLNAGGSAYWNAFGRPPYYQVSASAAKGQPVFCRCLKKGCSGTDVEQLQSLLKKAGVSPGSLDGEFGENTKEAVKLFQKANALKADGIAGKDTIGALGGIWNEKRETWIVRRVLKKKEPLMTGGDVKNLQKALAARGYSCVKTGMDGKFGDNTEGAVKRFQEAKGLKVDGGVGEKTATALGGSFKANREDR